MRNFVNGHPMWVVALLVSLSVVSVRSLDNGLARLPPMGVTLELGARLTSQGGILGALTTR